MSPRQVGGHSRRRDPPPGLGIASPVRNQPKPPWVRAELIRLKAWSPALGCRVIAEIFNRQFAARQVSVGKTYVATVLRRNKYEIILLRRTLKHRIPRPLPRNSTWALDLTGKTDLTGRQHMLLGLLDHGTRACLSLSALPDKRSLMILRELIATFRGYGFPSTLRVDNERCLNSRVIRGALVVLGIRLQTIDLHCPWQNGRIERFFGTLKRPLDTITVADGIALALRLGEFRTWYNHARPHQHLSGRTPAEAWGGRRKALGTPRPFSAWDGWLTGWWFPP
jgi:putative transposase